MLLNLHGLKYFLSLSGWLSINLVIFGMILNMSRSFLNTYGSYLMPIHHSYFYTYQFFPVAHNFSSLALYPHGATEAFSLAVPYAKIYDILYFYQPHVRSI